VSGGGR
jgi:hypothetical protein